MRGRMYAISDVDTQTQMLRLKSPSSSRGACTTAETSRAPKGASGGDDGDVIFSWAEFVETFACLHILHICNFTALDRNAPDAAAIFSRPVMVGGGRKRMVGLRLQGLWSAKKQAAVLARDFVVKIASEGDTHFVAALHQGDSRWEMPDRKRNVNSGARLYPINVTVVQIKDGSQGLATCLECTSCTSRARDVVATCIAKNASYKIHCAIQAPCSDQRFFLSLAASSPFEIVRDRQRSTAHMPLRLRRTGP